jgi:hypothetical protein
VGLPVDEAVDDLDAGAFELVGPEQVLLLVEAGLELDTAVTDLPASAAAMRALITADCLPAR